MDNPYLEMLEMNLVQNGVGYLLSTVKNPTSQAKYRPMLIALANEIYIAEGIVPPVIPPPTALTQQ
jgi:hypothetical protein